MIGKKLALLFICSVGIFYTLSFIQKEHIYVDKTATTENKILSIEVDEVVHKLNLLDSQGIVFSIPFSSIPIYRDYLQEQSDSVDEIERSSFELLPLNSSNGSKYGVLMYNCGNKLCSSLLVKLSETITSIELGNSMLMDMKQSPNLGLAAFRYGENEGNLVIRNRLILINLENMELLHPVSKVFSKEFVESATWPITEYEWNSDQNLSIRVADIQNADYNSLLTWFNGLKKTKKIEIGLVKNSCI